VRLVDLARSRKASGTPVATALDPVTMESESRDLVQLCRDVHARGWVANHDGNASVRLGDGRFLASPTAISKRLVAAENLVVVDAEGKVVHGTRKVFSEMALHLAAYRARPEARWVLHAHPPHATAWACAGESFWDSPFLAEAVVSLGEHIPLVSYTAPGGSTAGLEAALATSDAVLLGSHGVLVIAPDAETAFLRLELVEHLARVAAIARPLGGTRGLPSDDVSRLLEARKKAGLGPRTPAEAAPSAPSPNTPADIDSIVREALRRLA